MHQDELPLLKSTVTTLTTLGPELSEDRHHRGMPLTAYACGFGASARIVLAEIDFG